MTPLILHRTMRPHGNAGLTTLLGLTLAMHGTPLLAVDGTITITGEITAQTCKINGAEPPANLIVNLPKISTTALKNVNDVAGATAFQIKLTNCPESVKDKTLKAYFEPGPTVDLGTHSLIAYKTTSPPSAAASSIPSTGLTTTDVFSSVQIQLANADGSVIKVGESVAKQGAADVKASMTDSAATYEATLTYLARYVRTSASAITAGKLHAYVQYSIVYP